MDNDDYGKLIDFLGKKFDTMEERFESVEKKMATKTDLEDLERRTGILFEEVHHKFGLVIEGQDGIIQKLDRHIDENAAEHRKLERMVMEDRADIYNLKRKLDKA